MYSQAFLTAGESCGSLARAWPSVIVDTEKVLREADGPVDGSTKKLDLGGKVIALGASRYRASVPVRSPKIISGELQRHLHLHVQRHLNGKQKETKNSVSTSHRQLRIYARKFPRGHPSFVGPGPEEQWYGTYTDKPDGSWD